MSRSRLAQLSHGQLVELAAEACEGSRELTNKADALIAEVGSADARAGASGMSRSRKSRPRISRSRLAKLSHAQLVELAAEACEGSRELKNEADALIAEVAPLPSWCVDILMSPDLLYATQGSNPSLAD